MNYAQFKVGENEKYIINLIQIKMISLKDDKLTAHLGDGVCWNVEGPEAKQVYETLRKALGGKDENN